MAYGFLRNAAWAFCVDHVLPSSVFDFGVGKLYFASKGKAPNRSRMQSKASTHCIEQKIVKQFAFLVIVFFDEVQC